jgi:hypothetical protein
MRTLAIIFALIAAHSHMAVADDPPTLKQWQYTPSLEVPAEIPSDRCIRAIYGPKLEAERGYWTEWWKPPISNRTIEWFSFMRRQKNLVLEFCDHESAT